MSKKLKYIILAAGILGVFSFFLTTRFKKEPVLTEKIIVAVCCQDSSLLIYLAQQKGLFRKYGIDVQIEDYQSEELTLDSLIKDSSDLATTFEPVLVSKSFKERDLKIISVVSETRFDESMAPRKRSLLLVARQRWINQHPRLAQEFMKALIEAERILIENKPAVINVLQERVDYPEQYLQRVLEDYRYYVYLPQPLLLELERQAAWKIRNNLAGEEKIPNYLHFIYPYALEAIDPLRVTMIR